MTIRYNGWSGDLAIPRVRALRLAQQHAVLRED
jgi:hypothetical protein